jgi:hypothetical protein
MWRESHTSGQFAPMHTAAIAESDTLHAVGFTTISSAAWREGSGTAGPLASGSHGGLSITPTFAFACVTALTSALLSVVLSKFPVVAVRVLAACCCTDRLYAEQPTTFPRSTLLGVFCCGDGRVGSGARASSCARPKPGYAASSSDRTTRRSPNSFGQSARSACFSQGCGKAEPGTARI